MSDRAVLDLSNAQVKRTLLAFIRTAKGLHWWEVVKCRDQRTLDQNSFFHGVVVPHVAKRLTELWGRRVQPPEAKSFLKDKFLRTPIINRETGEELGWFTRETHKLDIGEMCEFLDRCIEFAVDMLDLSPELFIARPQFLKSA